MMNAMMEDEEEEEEEGAKRRGEKTKYSERRGEKRRGKLSSCESPSSEWSERCRSH